MIHMVRVSRTAIGIGCTAGLLVIALSATYVLSGNDTNERQLETNSSRQPVQGEQRSEPKVQLEGETMDKQSEQQGGAANRSESTTTVTVNGQRVEVPANGSYRQTIDNGDSRTEIKADSSQSSSTGRDGSNSSSSQSSVNLNVTTESGSVSR